jgi:hypothetical protein
MASTHTKHQAHPGEFQFGGGSTKNPRQASGSEVAGGATAANIKEAARQTGEQIKEQAESAAETVRRQGESFIDEQKSKAASEFATLSSAIRGAADKLRSDEESHAARYAEMAADRLEGVAHFIEKRDVGSLVRELEGAARRRPELFLGGMFLLGLGISRFLKASSRSDSDFNRDWRTQGSP